MAQDLKYGKVVLEHGEIEEDEPVIVFRAKDLLLPQVLLTYYELCRAAGSPKRHLELISESANRIIAWQRRHATKIPDSEKSREWMDH